MSITENVIAVDYHRRPFSRFGWLDTRAAADAAERVVKDYAVAANSADEPIGNLSGGNMQKVVLAREVAARPRFLIASQPTRGVDIGAAQFLRQQLIDLRDQGASVLRIGGPTMDRAFLIPLLIMAVAFSLLFVTLHLAAMRNEILRRRVRSLQMMQARAFSSEVGTGSREENAPTSKFGAA